MWIPKRLGALRPHAAQVTESAPLACGPLLAWRQPLKGGAGGFARVYTPSWTPFGRFFMHLFEVVAGTTFWTPFEPMLDPFWTHFGSLVGIKTTPHTRMDSTAFSNAFLDLVLEGFGVQFGRNFAKIYGARTASADLAKS